MAWMMGFVVAPAALCTSRTELRSHWSIVGHRRRRRYVVGGSKIMYVTR